jgi:large subunit ribosomal protein L9e
LNLDFQLITDEEGKKKLKVEAWFGSRKTSAAIRTALSHVDNLIIGVTKGYRYKMRFIYAHFPINASITNSNSAIEIRNFLGEKKVFFALLLISFLCINYFLRIISLFFGLDYMIISFIFVISYCVLSRKKV